MTFGIRKIENREVAEKKRKRNTLILSMIMITILLFSTAGFFSLQDNSDNSVIEGVQNIGDSWILNYGGQTFRITNSPDNGQNVSILTSANLAKYSGKIVYVASDNDAEFYELYSTLGLYTGRMQQACYGECDNNFPEKDCTENMIVVRSTNNSESSVTKQGKVYEGDNCLFIEGGMTAIDAFLYRLFGVN